METKKLNIVLLVLLLAMVGALYVFYFFKKANPISIGKKNQEIQTSTSIIKKLSNFPIEETTTPDGTTLPPAFPCVIKEFSSKKISLKDKFFTLFSAKCIYQDINEKKQTITIPLVVSNGEKILIHGFEIFDHEPIFEAEVSPKFWLSKLTAIGMKSNAHILYPTVENANPSLGRYGSFIGFGAETMRNYYSQENLNLFYKTGDPKHLDDLLWSSDIGLNNTLNNIDPNNLDNITP